MERVEIVEKDGKKYIDGEEVLLHIEYGMFGKTLLIFFSLFGLFLGTLLLVIKNTNIFLSIIALVIIIQGLWLLFDVLLFKEVCITKENIVKIWQFGECSIAVKDIKYAYRSFYKLNRGRVVFRLKKRNFFFYYFMAIHLLGVQNYKQVMLEMKKVFTNLNIIKGDEYEWNY